MQFAEKLDFLMNMTNTTNSALALNVRLDASHISRLRRGQRRALRNMACIDAMAEYFARHCEEGYRRKALSDTMEADMGAFGTKDLAERIARWLSEEKAGEVRTVEHFLTGLTQTPPQPREPVPPLCESVSSDPDPAEVFVFLGVEGKRRAVIRFLNAVLAQSRPVTLLLFSDEPTDWMTADRRFASVWASLMSQVLERGHRVVVIHTISRDLDEMLHAIGQWMPLYMSGAIEPYFYPKKRDGIFKRTLFIAPGIAAVASGSVGDSVEGAANLLFRDRASVEAHEKEFLRYLAMCKPLMRIFTFRNRDAYLETLLEFEKEKSDAVIRTESLSLLTMPEEVLSGILARSGMEGTETSGLHRLRTNLFESLLETNDFWEIVRLPDPDAVAEGKIKAAFSVTLRGDPVCYTAEEFLRHLEHLVFLLGRFEHFHVCLTRSAADERYTVYAKEDLGVIVAKTSDPPIVLAMREGNMNAAFWDFLQNMLREKSCCERDRDRVLEKLGEYIGKLRDAAGMRPETP